MSVFLICLIYMRLDFQSIFLAKQPLAHVQWNLYSVQFRGIVLYNVSLKKKKVKGMFIVEGALS